MAILGPADSSVERVPQLLIALNRSALARHGLSSAEFAQTVEALFQGTVAGEIVEDGVASRARATCRKMKQNLAWAMAHNLVAIPLATGVLYRAGIVLSPAIGEVFMSLSTVIAAINARLLGSVGKRLGGRAV